MNYGKLYEMKDKEKQRQVDCDIADVIKEFFQQHIEEHHEVEHRHKFVANGKKSGTDLGIKYYKLNTPYNHENSIEVENARIYPCINCGKMRSKSEGGTTFSLCDSCWKLEHDKKSNPNLCVCKHNHPLRGKSLLNGIWEKWLFCPVCGKHLMR